MDEALARDFRKDGKYDEAGHPLNGLVLEAERFCRLNGSATDTTFVTSGDAGLHCEGTLPPQPWGDHVANVRLRPIDVDVADPRDVVRVQITSGSTEPVSVTFTGTSFATRASWTFLPLHFSQTEDLTLRVETFGHGAVELDYIEVFKDTMQLTMGPGSSVLGDDDVVTLETPKVGDTPKMMVNGDEFHLQALIDLGRISVTETAYRRVYAMTVAQLANGRTGDLDVRASFDGSATRMMVYRAAPPCTFEGDPAGPKVLLTGFHPFPVLSDHENVSEIAVRALDPSRLSGVQVMRMVLPVEWDLGPARVTEAMRRCRPDVVVDLGQGSSGIDLEHVAANLKDAGNDDNRGHFQAGVPVIDGGATTLSSGLPLTVVKVAVEHVLATDAAALGEVKVEDSDDAGHYICNNTFYATTAAAAALGIRAGFIHLPYTNEFDDAKRAAWGAVAAAIVHAVVARN